MGGGLSRREKSLLLVRVSWKRGSSIELAEVCVSQVSLTSLWRGDAWMQRRNRVYEPALCWRAKCGQGFVESGCQAGFGASSFIEWRFQWTAKILSHQSVKGRFQR
jgi:hypothetical protein